MSDPERREPIKVIADVLKTFMELADGQVMLAYEKYDIPKTPGLFVALDYLASKVIGNNSYWTPGQGGVGLVEVLEVVTLYQIQIDLMSFNSEARTRKEEFYMAMRSVFAQQQMEQNLLQIARIPGGFQNTSSLEETKMLNRFTITINVSALSRKQNAVEYYDQFPTPEVIANV